MKPDIIHLKYPLDSYYREAIGKLSPMNKRSYRNQALNSTLCWTNTYGIDITTTTDVNKVTCKKCLLQIRKRGLLHNPS